MAQMSASTVQQRKEDVYEASQYTANFRCLVGEWHDCEELTTKSKEKRTFCGQKSGSKNTSNGVVCACTQIPLHELREKQ